MPENVGKAGALGVPYLPILLLGLVGFGMSGDGRWLGNCCTFDVELGGLVPLDKPRYAGVASVARDGWHDSVWCMGRGDRVTTEGKIKSVVADVADIGLAELRDSHDDVLEAGIQRLARAVCSPDDRVGGGVEKRRLG